MIRYLAAVVAMGAASVACTQVPPIPPPVTDDCGLHFAATMSVGNTTVSSVSLSLLKGTKPDPLFYWGIYDPDGKPLVEGRIGTRVLNISTKKGLYAQFGNLTCAMAVPIPYST